MKASKRNSSADDNLSGSELVSASGDPSLPSTPIKLANNHINSWTPQSANSMSSSTHYNSNRDGSQTSQPQSSQDDEDSAKENFDRDGGHSSGPGTDSTTTTPKSAKKKGISNSFFLIDTNFIDIMPDLSY